MRRLLICAALAAAAAVTPQAHAGQLCEFVIVGTTPVGGCVDIPLNVICTTISGPPVGAVICVPFAAQDQVKTAR
jgi:hypothetical protein